MAGNNPALIAVKAQVGLLGMVGVLVLVKAFLLAIIETLLEGRSVVRQAISRVGDRRDLDAHLRRSITPVLHNLSVSP